MSWRWGAARGQKNCTGSSRTRQFFSWCAKRCNLEGTAPSVPKSRAKAEIHHSSSERTERFPPGLQRRFQRSMIDRRQPIALLSELRDALDERFGIGMLRTAQHTLGFPFLDNFP